MKLAAHAVLIIVDALCGTWALHQGSLGCDGFWFQCDSGSAFSFILGLDDTDSLTPTDSPVVETMRQWIAFSFILGLDDTDSLTPTDSSVVET